MKKKILWTLAVLAFGFAVFAIPTVWLKPWSIEHFYARTFLGFALRHPMILSGMRILEPMGLDFHSNDLDDVSYEFQKREAAWLVKQLEILRSYDRDSMDEAGRLSYDVLEFFLDDAVRGHRFMSHDYPVNQLFGVQGQLFRAVRLVVDTGIHQQRWTREQAIEYMSSHTGIEEGDVVAEIERYIVNPGQACAYKVGQLKILELRERAREALGPRFDLRRFHNVVLANGAVPLTLLEQLVDRWIEDEKRSYAARSR